MYEGPMGIRARGNAAAITPAPVVGKRAEP